MESIKEEPVKEVKEEPKQLTLLQQAQELIDGQRQQDYGDTLTNFMQIAEGFSMVLRQKLLPGLNITPEEVALCMMQVKIARAAKSPGHRDSIMDIAGYAGCYDAIRKQQEFHSYF